MNRNEGPSNEMRDDDSSAGMTTGLHPLQYDTNHRSISPNTATISLNISENVSLREENGNVPKKNEHRDLNGQKDDVRIKDLFLKLNNESIFPGTKCSRRNECDCDS